ncbi:MAG: hypothetical protein LBR26_06355 [Prevotella sp.]|jgi:hypothetical protein|nr:hypothetical protein [Prevotella sp.]
MKKYKYFAVLSALVALFSFSSCESDYWKKGTLSLQFDLDTNNKGYARVARIVYIDEIPEFNPYRETLVGMTTKDTWIEISNLVYGDFIDRIDIDVAGVGVYSIGPISIRNDVDYITIDESSYRGYFNFMNDVNYRLYRDGRINLAITIYSNVYDGGPVYFDIRNIFDLQMRD